MTRLMCVSSGKGGVGKTTITSNLGSALSDFGCDTVVMDANLTNPSLGFHLGIPLYPKTLHDVLRDEAHISEATYVHNSGLKVVPAGISIEDLRNTSPRDLGDVLLDVVGEPDVVLIDSAAGLGQEAINAVETSDELLLVTNPDLPSVTDALKTASIAESAGTEIYGVVLNRVKNSPEELNVEEVESMIGHPVIKTVPEDSRVPESIAVKEPVVRHSPKSRVSREIKKLAAEIAGVDYNPRVEKKGLFSRLFSFLK